MSSAYKSNKINENNLTPCGKCDCLIISDSSDPNNDKCIRVKKLGGKEKDYYLHTSSDADDSNSNSDGIVINTKPNSTIKIYVNGPSDDDSTDKSTSTDKQVESAGSENNRNRICFRFCARKKKKDKVEPVKTAKEEPVKTVKEPVKTAKEPVKTAKEESEKTGKTQSKRNICNQTSKPCLNNCKTQSSTVDIVDIIKNCTNFAKPSGTGGGGGYNTNTIILQKDHASGDGIAGLESWLRIEAKSNSRHQEDILNELYKQRREIHELRDMLDTVVKGFREQLFMTPFGKHTKAEMFDDFRCMSPCNLERKSNTLSLKKSSDDGKKESVVKTKSITPSFTPVQKSSEEKKKKRFFPWCQ